MNNQNHGSFLLQNDLATKLILSFEPEADEYRLSPGEKVVIYQSYRMHPVTVKLEMLKDGEVAAVIWPGDGTIRVEKDGISIR